MAVMEGTASLPPVKSVRLSSAAELSILLLIIVVPLIASPPMAARIVDLPGCKVPNIIAALTFLGFLNGRYVWRVDDALQRGALIAFGAYLGVLTVAFLRSLPNVARLHSLAPESFPAGFMEYGLSYYVVPVLFALSFVYVLQCMCSSRGLLQTISAVSLAIFVLSCTIIVVMFAHPTAIFDPDPNRNAVNALTGDSLGLHYNSLGTMYVITGPLLVYMGLTRGSLWSVNLLLAIAAVLLLKSRTAIFTFAGMGVLTLIVLGRTKTLFALAPAVVAGALTILGKMIIGLLSQGITKSGISTFALLSGREQAIWLPLLAEWLSDPYRFWLGKGLFGIATSNFLYSAHSMFAAGEAHNFYLELFLDFGIVLFVFFVGALARWLRWSWRLGKRIHAQLYWVLFLCVLAFLIAGFTGRRYLPQPENLLLFPILATMINVARLRLRQDAAPGDARA